MLLLPPGKTYGNCFNLLHLLASAQPVFFLGLSGSTERAHCFCEAGVFEGPSTTERFFLKHSTALKSSWVLVNVDFQQDYLLPQWVEPARHIVWTSSPNARRYQFLLKRFSCRRWYMHLWSAAELDALR